jgi:hypothetical protein
MKIKLSELKKLIREEIDATREDEFHDIQEAIGDLMTTFIERGIELYDPADPSMQALGEAAWQEQVDAAAEDLSTKVNFLVGEVLDNLQNGEYYR